MTDSSDQMKSFMRAEMDRRRAHNAASVQRLFRWQPAQEVDDQVEPEDPGPPPFPDLGQGARGRPPRQPPTFGQRVNAAIKWHRSGFDDPAVRDAFYPDDAA